VEVSKFNKGQNSEHQLFLTIPESLLIKKRVKKKVCSQFGPARKQVKFQGNKD
jgi:hypothetical protein